MVKQRLYWLVGFHIVTRFSRAVTLLIRKVLGERALASASIQMKCLAEPLMELNLLL